MSAFAVANEPVSSAPASGELVAYADMSFVVAPRRVEDLPAPGLAAEGGGRAGEVGEVAPSRGEAVAGLRVLEVPAGGLELGEADLPAASEPPEARGDVVLYADIACKKRVRGDGEASRIEGDVVEETAGSVRGLEAELNAAAVAWVLSVELLAGAAEAVVAAEEAAEAVFAAGEVVLSAARGDALVKTDWKLRSAS
jgi:hypothetical protein